GKGDGAVTNWLREHDLAELPRLAEKLAVGDGWERAVEHVLGDALGAVCVNGLDGPTAMLADLREGRVTLFDTVALCPADPEQNDQEHPRPASSALVPVPEETVIINAHGGREKRRIRWIMALLRKLFRSRRAKLEEVKEETVLALPAPVWMAEEEETVSPLGEQVAAPWPLDALFAGVRTADDIDEALALRPALTSRQSIVTPTGEWLGRNWLRVHRSADPTAGVLPREREIKTLSGAIERLRMEIEGWESAQETAHRQRRTTEEKQAALQARITKAERDYTTLKTRLGEYQSRLREFRRRGQTVAHALEELREQRRDAATSLTKMVKDLKEKQAIRDRLVGERDAESARREEHQEHLSTSQTRWQQARDKAHKADLDMASIRARHSSLAQSGTRDGEQIARLDARCEELKQSLSGMDAPLKEIETALTEHRDKHKALEAALQAARLHVEKLDTTVRESDRQRQAISDQIEPDRTRLEKIRLARQEVHVRREAIGERIAASGYTVDALLDEIPEEANETDWEAMIETLGRRIARLGPINLAALQEHTEQSVQKDQLDSQHQDLTDALATLEAAIQDMDRETRTRFTDTFDKVNTQLGILFPRLFGGGHAHLELVGTDPLDAGVTVMARPPGKRNSTIAQLSGGEKALAAVALVFALFELNPAPFCLLDEVDAPLDDANVYRFRDLVKEMSERVQFVLITHNKNTMEIAHQLVGVTMHEPGVSRLVSVDIDQLSE
ncbi:MAG: AAA family ATPase, partial [Gammaproteobacteria bacterium]|nr:AAA family ATPase [Gammaproteobacteria bacterium]NNJ84503.1 AAA family ATPase [Gammaproteobacteria bacterium]